MIGHYLAVLNRRYVFRSSVSGRYVTRAYAALHPMTTMRQKVVK